MRYILNEMDADLKFTMEHSKSCIPFLDVSVIKREEKITADIFYKCTDCTFRPRIPGIQNVQYLARKICTIVSEDLTREQWLEELKIYLLKQNYPTKLTNQESQRPQQEKYHQSNHNRRINKFPHSTIRDNV
jgi:hypothetical protein